MLFDRLLSVLSKRSLLRKKSKVKKLLTNLFTELGMNVLRKILGPVKGNGVWMIRNNHELVDRFGAAIRFYLRI